MKYNHTKIKRKPPQHIVDYYNLLEEAKHRNRGSLFLKDTKRYRPIKVAIMGSIASLNFAQEELRKLYDIPDMKN